MAARTLVESPRVDAILNGIIEREGGYVYNPDDPGGATCWGITERVARRNGYTGRMQDLPQAFARRIYVKQYITAPRFDDVFGISPMLGEEMIDTGVNCGLGVPGTFLQRGLNVFNQKAKVYRDITVDGLIGENTLAMLEAFMQYRRANDGERIMLRVLDCLQGARYIGLAENDERFETFVFGWFAHRIGNVEV